MADRQSLLFDETKTPQKRPNRLSVQIPAPGESRISVSSPVRREKTINRRSTWFGKAFDAVGNNGVIDKLLFIKATHDIEDFVQNLFELFDTENRGYISIQELIGGLRLLMVESGKAHGEKTLQWFTNYFKRNDCCETCEIQFRDFKQAFENKTFTEKLFGLLDRNSDGVIDINEFIGSLDRLECATTDIKWFEWIEEHFNVASLQGRKITFEQFKETLQLEQVFFAERFFTLFDKNGDGKIDMKELIEGLELLRNGTVADKLTFLFRVYDLDGNGYLNREEMKTILLSGLEESKLRLNDQQVDELMEVFFEEVDSEHEGLIGLDEFKEFLLKYPGVAENLSVSVGHLLQPPTVKSKKLITRFIPKRFRWNYIQQNPSKVASVAFYFLVNVALFVWVAFERRKESGWIIVARTHGMCLNFNSVFILVLMLKSSLTWLRSTWIGKYLPIDQHIRFHKAVAVIIFILSLLHCAGHLGRYVTMDEDTHEVWEYLFTVRTHEGWVGGSAGITGILLLIILGIIFLLSQSFVREKGYFELFYFSHHLYVIWWILLILHAPNFWKWFIGPAVVYFVERLSSLRIVNRARYGKTFVQEGITYPSKVTHLVIKRPSNFHYKPGDYVLVNIPKIAKNEWHPFTISSSPEQSSNIWLHIRAVGTWTKKLYDHYEEEEKEQCQRCSLKRTAIRRQKTFKARESERDDELSIREQRARSIRRKRLGVLDEDDEEEDDELQEVVFEAKASSLRRSVKKKINKKDAEVELVNFSSQKQDSLTSENKLLIYLNGPYGTPSTDFCEAEHAVLISCGIGVTPFASILKSIMLRYQHASHSCPKCSYSWVGNVPFSLRKLQKVDFFWINRDQYSFEWFLSLLRELEVQQSEHEGVFSEHFLDMHIYMTSALRKQDMKALGLQLALELLHERKERDLITGLKTRTNAGRPDWEEVFAELKAMDHGHITVFYCGNAALGKILKNLCQKYKFGFKKENF